LSVWKCTIMCIWIWRRRKDALTTIIISLVSQSEKKCLSCVKHICGFTYTQKNMKWNEEIFYFVKLLFLYLCLLYLSCRLFLFFASFYYISKCISCVFSLCFCSQNFYKFGNTTNLSTISNEKKILFRKEIHFSLQIFFSLRNHK